MAQSNILPRSLRNLKWIDPIEFLLILILLLRSPALARVFHSLTSTGSFHLVPVALLNRISRINLNVGNWLAQSIVILISLDVEIISSCIRLSMTLTAPPKSEIRSRFNDTKVNRFDWVSRPIAKVSINRRVLAELYGRFPQIRLMEVDATTSGGVSLNPVINAEGGLNSRKEHLINNHRVCRLHETRSN